MSDAAASMDDLSVVEFAAGGLSHRVYRKGAGPDVLLIHELPGMTPQFVSLARSVADAGFSVHLPLFFGEPGERHPFLFCVRLWISREFRLFARHGGSPIINWLRAYRGEIFAKNGGKGIGVIGLCLTGNFAIALFGDGFTLAAVASEPALPFGVTATARLAGRQRRRYRRRSGAQQGRRPVDVLALLQRLDQPARAVCRDCGGVCGEFRRHRDPFARRRLEYSGQSARGPDREFLRCRRAPDAPRARPRHCVFAGAARLELELLYRSQDAGPSSAHRRRGWRATPASGVAHCRDGLTRIAQSPPPDRAAHPTTGAAGLLAAPVG
jgi:dienelactone hydrolase